MTNPTSWNGKAEATIGWSRVKDGVGVGGSEKAESVAGNQPKEQARPGPGEGRKTVGLRAGPGPWHTLFPRSRAHSPADSLHTWSAPACWQC